MLKVDARRTTWFLDLRRLVQLPRYAVAPRRILRFRRGSTAMDRGLDPATLPVASKLVSGLARPRRFGTDLVPMRRQTQSPVVQTTANDADEMTEPRYDVRGVAATLWEPPDRFPNRTSRPVLAPYDDNRASVTEAPSHPGYRSYGSAVDDHGTGVSTQPYALAPPAVIGDIPMFAETMHNSTSGSAAARTASNASRQPSRSGEQDTPWPDVAASDHRLAPDGDATAEEEAPGSNRPSVSVLHIDGAALGRWAVQHLERTLGRPATGMTGIDPRAALPRSRVAPF